MTTYSTKIPVKVLVFDTETTGLPPKAHHARIKPEGWYMKHPRIIQLSYTVYDIETGKIIRTEDDIVKLADDVEISEGSIEKHGITRERSQNEGHPIVAILHKFREALHDVDIYAGHNIYFDIDMIASEFHRNGIINPFSELRPTVHPLCTMRKGKYSTKIKMIDRNGETYIKSPTLQELYEHTYPTHSINDEKLHDSMNDVWLTLCIAVKMITISKCDPYNDCKEVRNAVNKILK